MKLSLFIIIFVCLGCSKNVYQIDKNAKLEPQFSLDATQFSNEDVIIRSCMKLEKVVFLSDHKSNEEEIKTKKESIQK
ncbi:hypothetical protein J2X31_000811 [Flavobacterium arsenatis]|uniref:Lipoprotein n=1 Tax=Flavobacterium arsenatis TaxID=1484332 RepID=A0ABU1TLR7_9FLAO|nr:hypothetical protein [Flavobacterium arsenatis]MDR6966813.1 hypothetical protein [Flavobacterium arsenatis]